MEEERRSEGRWRPASSRDPPRDAVAGGVAPPRPLMALWRCLVPPRPDARPLLPRPPLTTRGATVVAGSSEFNDRNNRNETEI